MTDVLDPPIASLDQPGAAGHEPIAAPTAPASRREPRDWIRTAITVVVVVGSCLYVLAQLHPGLMIKNTTPAGGDMGAHVWGPAYLRDHILPHFRLSGWAPDWYAGFPMYHFYMVIPALAVVIANIVLPYGVALKLVSAAGMLTLPAALWFFGRMAKLPFPVPELFSVAGVFFLFDETFTIYGGNIASTMAGEFSFSIALTLAWVFLGLFVFGMRTGKLRPLTAIVFALCVLSHLIVAFFAIIGAGLLFLFYADRRRAWWAASVGIVGGLLTAFWILPFWYRGPFMTDMFYERRTDFMKMFFPQSPFWNVMISGLAIIGVVGAIVRRYRPGMWLGALCLFYGVWARLWPQSHLWNARLLPFFYLTRYMLVVLGVVEVGRAIGRLISPGSERADRIARTATLGTVVVVSLLALGLHLENIPGLKQYYDGNQKRWEYGIASLNLGVKSKPAFVDDWAKWNYAGYEGKQAYGEYHGLVSTMKDLGQTRGCGRALWENNNDEDKYGTPMALMLLPFWTNGCIGSMEGLYFEAAGTTPYHFLTTSAMSQHSSNPVRRLRYEDGDVDKGVQYMQALGVRYYMAYNPAVTAKADANPELTQIATSGPWKIYEVKSHDLVVPLTTQPVVVEGMTTSPLKQKQSRDRWLEVGASWFQDQSAWAALPAASGPSSWQRISTEVLPDSTGVVRQTDDKYLARVGPSTTIDPVSLPAAAVSNVKTGDDSISFDVDRGGVPILVKASYFPNWKVSNAEGPYRVAPNMMVVVPKAAGKVRLHYGYTPIDVFAYLLTLLGIVGLFVLWKLGPVVYRKAAPATVAVPTLDDEPSLWFEWDEPAGSAAWAPPADVKADTDVGPDAEADATPLAVDVGSDPVVAPEPAPDITPDPAIAPEPAPDTTPPVPPVIEPVPAPDTTPPPPVIEPEPGPDTTPPPPGVTPAPAVATEPAAAWPAPDGATDAPSTTADGSSADR